MANAIVRFDPVTEKFETFPSSERGAQVRQMASRPGEAWGGRIRLNNAGWWSLNIDRRAYQDVHS